jgi:hypothetical protein
MTLASILLIDQSRRDRIEFRYRWPASEEEEPRRWFRRHHHDGIVARRIGSIVRRIRIRLLVDGKGGEEAIL